MITIPRGKFKGSQGEVLSVDGDVVRMKIDLFGRLMEMDIPRSDLDDIDLGDPRASIRNALKKDWALFLLREEQAFWFDQQKLPEARALDEQEAFKVHCREARKTAEVREAQLLSAFESAVGAAADDEVFAIVEADRARFFLEEAEQARLKAEWRADAQVFEAYKVASANARERRARAERAVDGEEPNEVP